MISMTAILLRMSTKCLLARAAELSSKWYKGGIGTNVFVKAWLCDKTGKDKITVQMYRVQRNSKLGSLCADQAGDVDLNDGGLDPEEDGHEALA